MRKIKGAAMGVEHRHIFGQLNGMLNLGCECVGWWNESDNNITKDFNEKHPDIPRFINKEDLSNRLKNKTNVLLFHGNLDTIVPPNNLLDAKDFLIRHKIRVQSKMIQNCDHTIPVEASSNALDYLKKNLENN